MGSRIDNLKELASTESVNWRQGILLAFLLPIYEAFYSLADLIEAIADVPISMLDAFGFGLGTFIDSLLGAPATLLDAGGQAAADSFDGIWGIFGPFNLAVAVAGVLAAAYLLALYAKEEETSDLIPFSLTDIPGLGADEDGGD